MNVQHDHRNTPARRSRKGLRNALRNGVIGVIGALVIGAGTALPAVADPVQDSLVLNVVTGPDGGNGWKVMPSAQYNRLSPDGSQLRVPSASTRAVPDGEEFGWLGAAGEVRWNTELWEATAESPRIYLSTYPTRANALAADDPNVYWSISNIEAPGAMALYEAPEPAEGHSGPTAPGDLFRWGTGERRDGAAQGAAGRFALPARKILGAEASFSASGMYCFDLTTEATRADGTAVSDTTAVRISVGDAISADAACGTPSGEDPGLTTGPEEPAAPGAPEATADGDSVTVEWEPPSYAGASSISGYTVRLTGSRDEFVQEVDGDRTVAVFQRVPAGYYRASVIAKNAHGESQPSAVSNEIAVGDSPVAVVAGRAHIDAIAPQVDTDEATGEQTLALRAQGVMGGRADWDDFVLYTDKTFALPGEFSPENDWSFIGEPGETVWESPFTQSFEVPWVGLSTEHESLREHVRAGESIGVRVEAVTGADGGPAPGDFALNSGGANATPRSGQGLLAGTRAGLPSGYLEAVGTHAHYGWYFTAPGVYCIAIAVDTVLEDGMRRTAREQLTHVVGDTVDPATVAPCGRSNEYPAVEARRSVAPAETGAAPFVVENGFNDISLNLDGDALDARLLYGSSYRNALPEHHGLEEVIFRGKSQGERYTFGTTGSARDEYPYLHWNTFGVSQDEIVGDLTWTVSDVRGPGELTVEQRRPVKTAFDTANGAVEASVWAQSGTSTTGWFVTRPGKYCIDLNWSAQTKDHGAVAYSQTLTAVVDGEGFEHDASTLALTCADGGEPTPPGDDLGPGEGSDPEVQPWDVPNWAETESGATILNLGHVDLASVVEGGGLNTLVKDTTAEGAEAGKDDGWVSWHEPEGTVFQLLPESAEAVADGRLSFIGELGASYWLASEIQNDEVLWPGWSTEEIPVGVLDGGLTWRLTGAEGPGEFFLYTGEARPVVHFGTADGIDDADVLEIPEAAHRHGNWAFTAEGTYCLAFERAGNLASGEHVSDDFTLTVAVGRTDPTKIDPAHCAAGSSATVPAAPAAPTATADGDAATVEWAAPADGGSPITGYTVTLHGGEEPISQDIGPEATTAVFENLAPGVYTTTVAAINGVGASPASDPSNAVAVEEATDPDPEPTVPDAPAAPVAAVDGDTVTVTWAAPASDGRAGLTGYEIALYGGVEPLSSETGAAVTEAVFSGLAPGTYTASVVAVNTVGASEASPASNEVTVPEAGRTEPGGEEPGGEEPGGEETGEPGRGQTAEVGAEGQHLARTGGESMLGWALGGVGLLLLAGAALAWSSARRARRQREEVDGQ